MSVISSLGYPDWQRLTNWDGPVLWQPTPALYNAPISSPLARVDRYHTLSTLLDISTGQAVITFDWYADFAQTAHTGQRVIYLDANFGNTCVLRLVNLGAWCKVTIAGNSGVAYRVNSVIIAASNRAITAEFSPTTAVLVDNQNFTVGAGVNGIVRATPVVAGRAHIWSFTTNKLVSTNIFMINPANGYDLLMQSLPDANGEVNLDIELPDRSIYVRMDNGTASTSQCYVSLVCNGR